jgi:hypothetical protein
MIVRMMMVILAMAFVCTTAFAQSADDDVRAVIDALFDAMRAGDGDAVQYLFHPDAMMKSVVMGEAGVDVRKSAVDRFAAAVGSPRDDMWDEHIDGVVIQVDGPLATAWMEYGFFVGMRFSHCGANAMEFVLTADGWRILGVTDTRRVAGCERWTDGTQ